MEQQLWYLENVDVTTIFCPVKLQQVSNSHVVHNFKKGAFIFLPNDSAERIYFLMSGRIKIGTFDNSGKEIIKAILSKGEVFGELALTGQDERRNFALAMEASEVCSIHRDELKTMMRDHSGLQMLLMKILGSRMLNLEQRVESLVFKDSRSRIIELVHQLALEKGERVGYEVVIRKFITHQEIAKMTATSRQSVTTVLNDLRNKDIITFNRKRLLVRDMNALAKEYVVSV